MTAASSIHQPTRADGVAAAVAADDVAATASAWANWPETIPVKMASN